MNLTETKTILKLLENLKIDEGHLAYLETPTQIEIARDRLQAVAFKSIKLERLLTPEGSFWIQKCLRSGEVQRVFPESLVKWERVTI